MTGTVGGQGEQPGPQPARERWPNDRRCGHGAATARAGCRRAQLRPARPRHRDRGVVRLHQRFPRHGQRDGDLDRHRRPEAAGGRRALRRAQPRGGVPVGVGGRDDRQRDSRVGQRHAADHLRRPARRHRVERLHLVRRDALELVHALVGGVIGATVVAAGFDAVKGSSILSKVIIPAVLSPVIAALVAALATFIAFRVAPPGRRGHQEDLPLRPAGLGLAGLTGPRHQRRAEDDGVVTLALIADGRLSKGAGPSFWVIAMCGLAIALGTYLGGWRVIRTVGHRLFHIRPRRASRPRPRPRRCCSSRRTAVLRCRPRRSRPVRSSGRGWARTPRRSGGARPGGWSVPGFDHSRGRGRRRRHRPGHAQREHGGHRRDDRARGRGARAGLAALAPQRGDRRQRQRRDPHRTPHPGRGLSKEGTCRISSTGPRSAPSSSSRWRPACSSSPRSRSARGW